MQTCIDNSSGSKLSKVHGRIYISDFKLLCNQTRVDSPHVNQTHSGRVN